MSESEPPSEGGVGTRVSLVEGVHDRVQFAGLRHALAVEVEVQIG